MLFAVFNGRSVNKLNSRCQKTALDNDAYSFALSFVRNLTSESNCGVTAEYRCFQDELVEFVRKRTGSMGIEETVEVVTFLSA